MKYYDEDKTKDIRTAFDKDVLKWPDVTTRKMFGCPCYLRNKKLFVLLVTDGVVLTKLKDEEINELADKFEANVFTAGGKTVKAWREVPIAKPGELKQIIPYIRKSYENAD